MMKKLTLTLLLVLLVGVGVGAQQSSLVYGPLASSATFRLRVTYIIATTAPVILTEAGVGSYTAPCHTLRAKLAAAVARDPDSYTPIFAAHLVTSVTVTTGGAPTGTSAAGTLDTPATDAALLAAVATQWSTVAGCITNP